MAAEVTRKFEVITESGVVKDPPGIPADGKMAARFEEVMSVEPEGGGEVGEGPPVKDSLPIIFTGTFKFLKFEESIGGGEKSDVTGSGDDL